MLLAGGRSSRMGENKVFINIDGVPLWRRQIQILQQLQPVEIFVAGPAHQEWIHEDIIIIPDAQPNAGPLAAVVSALRRCSAPLLLALAVDLPRMTGDYLAELLAFCTPDRGIVPRGQPLAAVYPAGARALAESCLRSSDRSMQQFAMRCVTRGLVRLKEISLSENALFANMNTPEDVELVSRND
ncbi:MAG: molybdenum cofactor guanylyltransferase [Verrucomicrobiaceae bacterium]|nr:molybdenum cofactor guanylyltransferase [Verrucomicrobiaceae bacterium]